MTPRPLTLTLSPREREPDGEGPPSLPCDRCETSAVQLDRLLGHVPAELEAAFAVEILLGRLA